MTALGGLAPVPGVALGDGLDETVTLDNDGVGGGDGDIHRLMLLQRLQHVMDDLGGHEGPRRIVQHHFSGRVGHEVL